VSAVRTVNGIIAEHAYIRFVPMGTAFYQMYPTLYWMLDENDVTWLNCPLFFQRPQGLDEHFLAIV